MYCDPIRVNQLHIYVQLVVPLLIIAIHIVLKIHNDFFQLWTLHGWTIQITYVGDMILTQGTFRG
jgi:hypothetical protein